MSGPRILVLSGSIECDHPASRLADAAQLLMAQRGADVARISLLDYPAPLMEKPPAAAAELPRSVMSLSRMIHHHDGLFLSLPVVSRMPPPLLVNMIAWTLVPAGTGGRQVWVNRTVALAGVASGAHEASDATAWLRAALEDAGATVVDTLDMACGGADGFDEDGWIRDASEAAALENLCGRLCDTASNDRKTAPLA